MLRSVSLGQAATLVVLSVLSCANPAFADNVIGGTCSTGGGSARSADGNNEWCNGSTWQYPAYQFGSTAASCTSGNAGQVQWTGTLLQTCNGTTWKTLGFAASGIYLGTTTTATNPQRSGDATTGLLSPAPGSVAIATGGAEALRVTASGWVGIGTVSPVDALTVVSGDSANSQNIYITGTGAQGVTINTTGTSGNAQAGLNYENTAGYALTGLTAAAGRLLNSSAANQLIFNNRIGPIIFSADSGFTRQDMFIATSGAVGIGTSSPTSLLTVGGTYGAGNVNVLQIGSGFSALNANLAINWAGSNVGISNYYTAYSSAGFDGLQFTTDNYGVKTTAMTILGNGNVGIGSTNPQGPLDVDASSGLTIISLKGYVTNYANLDYNGFYFGSDSSHEGFLAWRNSLNRAEFSTQGYGYPLYIDASVIALQASPGSTGSVGIGTTSPSDRLDVAGGLGFTATTSTLPLNGLYSSTRNSLSLTTSGATALYVSAAGSVGIGTNSPIAKLEVNDSGSNYMRVTPGWYSGGGNVGTWIDLDTNGPSGIGTGGPGGNAWLAYAKYAGNWTSDSASGDIAIRNTGGNILFQAANGGGNAHVAIIGTGNVGIGTVSPKATLDIIGFAKLKINSSAPITCNGTQEGSVAYTGSTTHYLCYCDGTSWKQVQSPATSCAW